MNPWFETLLVAFVAFAGIVFGTLFSRIRKGYWTFGCLIPLLFVALLLLTRCSLRLALVEPLRWVAMGRVKFVILSLAVTMGLTTPLSRLRYRFERVIVCLVMAACITWVSILPFLVPALIKGRLLSLGTRLDENGVCLQTTRYTCGPAAAVTALAKLGLPAEEGELAVLSRSSPLLGTLPACLSSALEQRYSDQGLRCTLRHFSSIDQLRDAPVTLAVVKDAFLLDHCLAVLDVSDEEVTVADPVLGRRSMSREQFERIWRFSGIVLTIAPPPSI